MYVRILNIFLSLKRIILCNHPLSTALNKTEVSSLGPITNTSTTSVPLAIIIGVAVAGLVVVICLPFCIILIVLCCVLCCAGAAGIRSSQSGLNQRPRRNGPRITTVETRNTSTSASRGLLVGSPSPSSPLTEIETCDIPQVYSDSEKQ